VKHEPVPHLLAVYLIHLLPAVTEKVAFIIETYIQKGGAPSQPVREIEAGSAPFIQFLPAMRTRCFFLVHYFHISPHLRDRIHLILHDSGPLFKQIALLIIPKFLFK
jgi:hypothetical protein